MYIVKNNLGGLCCLRARNEQYYGVETVYVVVASRKNDGIDDGVGSFGRIIDFSGRC